MNRKMNETECIECEAIGSILKKREKLVGMHIIEKKKIVGIYGLQNKIDDSRWYIGQSHDIFRSIEKRYKNLRCKNQTKIYNALKKHGFENFKVVIIEMCDPMIPQDMLDIKEVSWIKHYNAKEHGYNISPGGKVGIGFGGRKHSVEARQKISESNKRRKLSVVSIEKMKASLKGRKWTDEQRKNILAGKENMSENRKNQWRVNVSKASLGRKMPEKTDIQRKKMSDAQKGKHVGIKNLAFGKRWITNGIENKFIDPTKTPLDIGWRFGCLGKSMTDETKKKISLSKMKKNKVIDKPHF